MSDINQLASGLYKTLTESDNRKPKAYDVKAKVLRIEDDTVWVKIPGGIDETPVQRTDNANPGDDVRVRVAGGRAWLVGNNTNPATDDKRANQVYGLSLPSITYVSNLLDRNISVDSIASSTGYIVDLYSKNVTTENIKASTGYIDELTSNNITAEDITASSGYIKDLEAENITADDIIADHETVGSLDANYAHITNGVIDNAKIDQADVNNLSANYAHVTNGVIDNAKIGHADVNGLNANYAHITNGVIDNASIDYADVDNLSAHYAEIDLANVNNAWIQNGLIKDAAITDAKILGVSANKLTAGTIDASNITVTNLNASNITTGSITVDGITIDVDNNEASIDGSYIEDGTITMSGLSQEVQDVIDGAIETYTGTVVPTLNNAPANAWTTTKLKDQHIGDVYYVVNSASDENGYCYRFTKSGSTYSWQLIKDSDVTAALQRLQTAEGKISNIESFDEEMATFKTETEGDISTLQTKTTSLETSLGDKVDKTTFNAVKQTVDGNSASITELSTITTNNGLTKTTNITNTVNTVKQTATGNSSKISSLTTTLGTNADGTTKAGDIVHRTTAIEQDLDGFKTTVEETYATQTEVDGKADADMVYTKSEINQTVNNINTSISSKANSSDVYTKSQIDQTVSGITTTIESKANSSDVYTKTQIDQTVSGINSTVSAKANASDVYTKTQIDQTVSGINASVSAKADGAETTAALSLKANKATLTSEINASADTVKINADRVNIEGAAIFTSGRLSQTSLNNAYDSKGSAATAKAEAIAEIPTNVSALTNDAGYQDATQVSTAVTTGVSGKADKTAAVSEEQYIYISKASGTSSVSKNTTWVTRADDVQNTWTTKRPTYNPSYPVLFVAKQKKVVSGTVTCTTPVKDDTTTVIDGGHITTGTIDASQVTVTNINANNITSGTLSADRIGAGSITISNVDSTIQNAVETAQNTFIFDTTYTMSGTTASFEAHLYKGGVDVKEYVDGNDDPLYPPSMFTWYLKHEDSQTQEGDYIGYGYRINVDISTCNYGAEVIAHFTTTEDSPLLNGNDDNLTDANNNTLTGRTESGESVRVRDLTVATSLSGADKLMVIGAEDEHLVSVNTLQAYLNANLDKQVKFNTTAGWNSQITLVSQANTLYVYTDHQIDSQGRNIAGIKAGDGNAYVVDLPFADAIATEHIADTTRHITDAERTAWNNKVRCYYAGTENLIFTTA